MTHKVLKSGRSKMATLALDVCDVHRASSLYIKTCWQSLYRGFPTGGIEESPTPTKNLLTHPLPTKFLFPPTKSQFNPIKNKSVIFSCIHYCCTIFVLISCTFMLVLILIDVQYSQNAVFSFENFSNRQNHLSQKRKPKSNRELTQKNNQK